MDIESKLLSEDKIYENLKRVKTRFFEDPAKDHPVWTCSKLLAIIELSQMIDFPSLRDFLNINDC